MQINSKFCTKSFILVSYVFLQLSNCHLKLYFPPYTSKWASWRSLVSKILSIILYTVSSTNPHEQILLAHGVAIILVQQLPRRQIKLFHNVSQQKLREKYFVVFLPLWLFHSSFSGLFTITSITFLQKNSMCQ